MRTPTVSGSSRARLLDRWLGHTLGLGLIAATSLAGTAKATERPEPTSEPTVTPVSEFRARLALLDQAPPMPPALPGAATYAITPERRALLNTIRFAEGTWANGDAIGYRILFGGSLMERLDQHPNRVMRTRGYASAAAGAYQFMPFTWALASQALGLSDFGPDHQDQAAIFLIQRRGALALADQGVLSPELTARLAPEWASFPTLSGASFYGQPVRPYSLLRRFYEDNLAALRAAAGLLEVVAQAPKACEDSDRLCRLERLGQRP
ncbi:MAG: endolysin [Cyanobacteriota bacterium]